MQIDFNKKSADNNKPEIRVERGIRYVQARPISHENRCCLHPC